MNVQLFRNRRVPSLCVRTAYPLAYQITVLGFARGDKGQGCECAASICLDLVFGEFCLKNFICVVENLLYFRAVVRRGVAVIREGFEGECDLQYITVYRKVFEVGTAYDFRAFFFGYPVINGRIALGFRDQFVYISVRDIPAAISGNKVLVPPDQEFELSVIFMPLCLDDGLAQHHPHVLAGNKLLPVDTDDDIAPFELAIGGGPFLY